MKLSKTSCEAIDEWLKRYPVDQKRSGVLQALMIVQAEHGWLSETLMNAVADYLDLPPIAVYEVATFYSLYHLKPVGRYMIDVCTNVSCLLRGSEEIVAHLKKRLNILPGQTTSDGRFTLREVECLAACAGAPACQIGKKYFENLTPESVDALLNELTS